METIKDVLAGVFIIGGMSIVCIVGIIGFMKVWRETRNIKEND